MRHGDCSKPIQRIDFLSSQFSPAAGKVDSVSKTRVEKEPKQLEQKVENVMHLQQVFLKTTAAAMSVIKFRSLNAKPTRVTNLSPADPLSTTGTCTSTSIQTFNLHVNKKYMPT
jgi:hypothetical protein